MPAVPDDGWAPLRDALAADVRRVSERLRTLSQARLQAPAPPFTSRSDAAREAARVLAVAAQGVEAGGEPAEPTWRVLPQLADFAVGDQVAVTGNDLLAALGGTPPDRPVWAPGGRRPARDVVAAASETLAATRRLL